MDLGRPHAAVSPTLDGDVLIVLAGTTGQLTGREVARLVKRGSPAGVNLALKRLADQGVVDAQPAGRAVLYSLNREHLACPAVENLARLRSELIERLRTALGSWKIPPAHASLFGSAARGDGDAASDIDILVVIPRRADREAPTWREQLGELARRVTRWTGNRCSMVELSESDLARMAQTRSKLLTEIRRDAVVLFGTPLSDRMRPR